MGREWKPVHVLDKRIGTADIFELSKAHLSNDSAKFAACCRNSMGGGPIACRKNFPWDDESGGVRAKVLKKIGKTVEDDKYFGGGSCACKIFIAETYGAMKTMLTKNLNIKREIAPMIVKMMVSMMKPRSWIGLRPHLSMKKNDAQ